MENFVSFGADVAQAMKDHSDKTTFLYV